MGVSFSKSTIEYDEQDIRLHVGTSNITSAFDVHVLDETFFDEYNYPQIQYSEIHDQIATIEEENFKST